MSLSQKEITEILNKIREEYKTYAKENPKAFDLHGFEKRYLQILQMKMDVSKFLKEEVQFLEQLKSKHKELLQKKEASKQETINRIMDENLEKLAKYEKFDFHPLARPEMRYFYGAMIAIGNKDLPVLLQVLKGTPEYREIQDSLYNLERLTIRRGIQSPPRFVDHIKALLDANGNQTKMDKDTQELLKSACITLNKLAIKLQDMIQSKKISDKLTIFFDEKEYPQAAVFNNKTHKEAIEWIIQNFNQIIDDFRMRSIVNA